MRFYPSTLICLMLLLAGGLNGATNYYIDQVAGNDASSGTAATSPWKTLAKANAVTHVPGDTLFLKCRSVWVEGFIAKGDGDSLHPVVLTSYGTGRDPGIEGAHQDNSICVYMEGVSHWKVQNLEISHAEYGIVIDGRKSVGKKGITIEKCFFHNLRTNADYYRTPQGGPTWGGAIQVWSHQTIGIPSNTVRVDDIRIRNCISQNCDGFVFQRHNDGGDSMGFYGNLLIDGCTVKGHSFNTVMLIANHPADSQIIRNCVFMNNGGLRRFYNGGTDVMMGGNYNMTIEDCEFGNRTMASGDPDGCALDYESDCHNSIIRRCDIHGCRSGALLVMHWDNFTNVGMLDCLLRHNGREYAKYEIYNQSNTVSGPIQGNTYYLLSGTAFLSKNGAFSISNNTAGAKAFVATPAANFGEDTYSEAVSVSLSCATEGAVIHYTTDGSYPNTNSPVYSGPVLIGRTTALNAKAFKDGMEQSYGLSNIYVIESTPNLSIALVDSITQQPVKTSTVVELLHSSTVVADKTDSTGSFFFLGDSAGGYTLNIAAKGYTAKSGVAVALIDGKTTRLVLPLSRQALSGIAIRPKNISMDFHRQQPLSLYGTYADGAIMLMENTVPAIWISRSPELVNVSADGLLTSDTLSGSCFVTAELPSLGLKDSTAVAVVKIPLIPLNNPGFETPVISGIQYRPSDPAWVYSAGGSGIQHNGSDFLAENAPEGVQTGFLQNVSSLSQQVDFPAGAWQVKLSAAKRTSWGGSQTIRISIDSIVVGTFTPTTGAFVEYATPGVLVGAGSHRLILAGTSAGDNTAFVDQVSIVYIDTLITEDEPPASAGENTSFSTSPNPFNPSVNIRVKGCNAGAELKILDITGKIVADLSTALNGGTHAKTRQVAWNAAGRASGVYIVMLRNGDTELKRKVLLIR